MSWTWCASGRSPTRCCTSAWLSPDDLFVVSVNPRSEGTTAYAAQDFRIKKSENSSLKSFSFDQVNLLPGGGHRIWCFASWLPSMKPSQYSWNASIWSGDHESGADAKAAGSDPAVNLCKK